MIICRCKIHFKHQKSITNDYEVKDSTHMLLHVMQVVADSKLKGDDVTSIQLKFIDEYDEFSRLLQNGKDKQFIRKRLRLSDQKYHEMLNYYRNKKEQLTMSKYKKMVAKGLSREQIEEYFKIPKSELDYFLDKHNE